MLSKVTKKHRAKGPSGNTPAAAFPEPVEAEAALARSAAVTGGLLRSGMIQKAFSNVKKVKISLNASALGT